MSELTKHCRNNSFLQKAWPLDFDCTHHTPDSNI